MAEPLKFTFDKVFSRGGAGHASKSVKEIFSGDDMKTARTIAMEEGFETGRGQAMDTAEGQIADALTTLMESSEQLSARLDEEILRIRAEAGEMALSVIRKLAPALIARAPLAETMALLDDCMSHLNSAPHIVIRTSEDLTGELRTRAEALASERGFRGKIVILGEAGIAPGDCRIEWADGGVSRDSGAVISKIEAAVNRHVNALMPAGQADKEEPVPGNPDSEGEEE